MGSLMNNTATNMATKLAALMATAHVELDAAMTTPASNGPTTLAPGFSS